MTAPLVPLPFSLETTVISLSALNFEADVLLSDDVLDVVAAPPQPASAAAAIIPVNKPAIKFLVFIFSFLLFLTCRLIILPECKIYYLKKLKRM